MNYPYGLVRVSTPDGHFNMVAAVAEREGSGVRVLKQSAYDKNGHPRPPKLRVDLDAATPTPESEATDVSADTEETA